jgi:hypothetical protein
LTWLRYCGSCKRYGKRSTGLIVNKHGTIDWWFYVSILGS